MNARDIALRCVTEEPGARDIEHWIAQALTEARNEAYEEAAAKLDGMFGAHDYTPESVGWQAACHAGAAAIRAKIERE